MGKNVDRYTYRVTWSEEDEEYVATLDIGKTIQKLRKRMKDAADQMDFEQAAELRDRVFLLEKRRVEEGIRSERP